ncbi:PiggyBac transposable element-derived protein 4, partial [Harpegnathos saltator]
TSPHLYNLLHEKEKTNAFGTVRKNRKDMPKMEEKLKGGECTNRSTHNLLALKWRDKKDVWMLSTSHSDDFVETKKINYQTGEPKRKPKCVADYNALMGAVDKIDMILSSLHCVRKSTKWYKKYFFHLLDLAIYNAYILYKEANEKIVTFEKFHLLLIKDILREYPPDRVEAKGGRSHSDDLPFRLTERHFPTSCVTNENRKHSSRRRCAVCTKNNRRSDSRYECKKCNVGLCIEPCFEIYHTIQNY